MWPKSVRNWEVNSATTICHETICTYDNDINCCFVCSVCIIFQHWMYLNRPFGNAFESNAAIAAADVAVIDDGGDDGSR